MISMIHFEFISASADNEEIRWALIQTRRQLSEKRGLLCFSLDWKNPVQWSHYADRHRGLCIDFDVPEADVSRVVYVSQRETIDREKLMSDGLPFMDRMMRTKFKHWSYEREVRMFVNLEQPDQKSGLYFKSFCKNLQVTDVIVGVNSDISRTELNRALGSLADSVKCKKARLAFRTFKVVEQRKASLWS